MNNELEQVLHQAPAAGAAPASKATPEVMLIKDHPHLVVGPPHAAGKREQSGSERRVLSDEGLVVPQRLLATEHMKAVGLYKSYHKGPVEVPVLAGLDIEVRRGEFVAIVGQSGSGKSTLLHLLGTLDAPDRGEICFNGRRIDNLPTRQCDALRNRCIGMIFQFYHLLPELSTLENVLSPLMIADGAWNYFAKRKKHRARAIELLEIVGLANRLKHKPRELSGGEMQRAAIARALVAQPELLLADEPTGNLDQATGQEILKILRTLNRERRLTIVMVTHDQAIARQADRIVRLAQGRIEK
jgi:lipoprotein-releasing system ATP-binding protein